MRTEPSHTPYFSSGVQTALMNGHNPFNTGGLEDMRKEDIAPYTNQRFTPNNGVPTFEVAQQSAGEIYAGWSIKNSAVKKKNYPFIVLKRSPAREEGASVGDKFHISVNPKDAPKAFEIIGKLVHSQESPINSWKATDLSRIDPRDTRLSLGAQFTLYPKPDRPDGTYSPELIGKINALVKTIEQALQDEGIGKSDHRPTSDVSAAHWSYASYRNEIRSDRQGSESQRDSLKQEPFFKLVSST